MWIYAGKLPKGTDFFVTERIQAEFEFDFEEKHVPLSFITLSESKEVFEVGKMRALIHKFKNFTQINPVLPVFSVVNFKDLSDVLSALKITYGSILIDIFANTINYKAHCCAIVDFLLLKNDAFFSNLVNDLRYNFFS